MHIGIDLGYQESKIAYRQDGIWEYQIMPPFSLAQASGDGADEVALVNKLASLCLQAIKDTDATVII